MLDKQQMDELFSMANNNPVINKANLSDNGKDKLNSMLKNLNPADLQKVKSILGDKEKTEQILSSPQAQALLKKLNNPQK